MARDADSDPAAAFASIQDAFRRAQAIRSDLVVPDRARHGAGTSVVTMAIVFPDGQRPGDIETLIWDALTAAPVAPRVNSYVACLTEVGLPLAHEAKARVYAFLASLGRPEMSLGVAGRARRLPLQSDVFAPLIDLLPADHG